MKSSTLILALSSFAQLASYGQWSTFNLSSPRAQMASAVIGPKILYAGGDYGSATSTLVEIYDTGTDQWTTTNMSMDRRFATAVSSGSKYYVAGGLDASNGVTAVVDIYDTLSQQWTVASLSQARFSMTAVSLGNVVLFAGGSELPIPPFSVYDRVDIYNTSTGIWSTAALSQARAGAAGVVADGKAFFAGGELGSGGVSDRVDIYDSNTGTWSTATLSVPRVFIGAVAVGNKVLFAGGVGAGSGNSDRVDIYDTSTDTWSIGSLSVARGFSPLGENVAALCGKAYFVGGNGLDLVGGGFTGNFSEIDVYDGTTGSWSVDDLPSDRFLHSTRAVDNQLFVAGGVQIVGANWILYNDMRIFTDASCNVGIQDNSANGSWSVFPNPASEQMSMLLEGGRSANFQMMDAAGRVVLSGRSSSDRTMVPVAHLPRGVYLLRVELGGSYANQLIVLH